MLICVLKRTFLCEKCPNTTASYFVQAYQQCLDLNSINITSNMSHKRLFSSRLRNSVLISGMNGDLGPLVHRTAFTASCIRIIYQVTDFTSVRVFLANELHSMFQVPRTGPVCIQNPNTISNACVDFKAHHKVNSSTPGQNGRHFEDDIFICIWVNKKFCILIKIWLMFVHKSPIDDDPALVKIMAWRRIGDKPLSEPMLTHFTDACMRH